MSPGGRTPRPAVAAAAVAAMPQAVAGRAAALVAALVVSASVAAPGAGCGSGGGGPHEDPLVASVRAGIGEQLGAAPSQVSCAGGRCDVDVGGRRGGVTVAGERELDWQSDEVVLAAPLVAHIRAELAALGLEAAIDCGPPIQPVPADGRIACKVGEEGVAWVQLGDGGQVDVDVALTPAEVAARTAPADEEALERMSRALDRPDFDLDAGVDDPARAGDHGDGDDSEDNDDHDDNDGVRGDRVRAAPDDAGVGARAHRGAGG
jgi:hypothetical protein